MQPVNAKRVFFGGIVAAVIIDLIEGVMNGVVLKTDWATAMQALGKSGEVTGAAIALYNIVGVLEGIVGVWMYSALISRYGVGSTTSGKAGLVVWALVSGIPGLIWLASGLLPGRLLAISTVVDFISILLGVTMGALLYREENAPIAQAARA